MVFSKQDRRDYIAYLNSEIQKTKAKIEKLTLSKDLMIENHYLDNLYSDRLSVKI